MTKAAPASTESISTLTFAVLKLSSRLVMAGDRLVADLGLTSARWQVLGEIVVIDRPRTVSDLARDIGGSRQNVLRIVNFLRESGLVEFAANPSHRRAQLVVPTERGQAVFAAALEIWEPVASELARGVAASELRSTEASLTRMRERLEAILDEIGVGTDPE